MDLLFGYSRMDWAAHISPEAARDLGEDVAVLCIGADAPAILPPATRPPGRGDSVSVIGYGAPRRHVQTATACNVLEATGSRLLLDCPESAGASGAPVLDDRGAAVAVMSRTGRASSLAVALPRAVTKACR